MNLCYLYRQFKEFDTIRYCFGSCRNYTNEFLGRPCFLADTVIKGDFSIYLLFINEIIGKNYSQIKQLRYFFYDGVFALMFLFLRLDLIKNYIHWKNFEPY